MNEAKPFEIDKRLVYEAYKKVKSSRGSSGIDGVEMQEYEENMRKNLYRLWNRMSSGSYFPKAVKLVEIPKSNGGKRPLGIPTIEDRIAQMSAVIAISPEIEPYFMEDSYGYRPNKCAHDAIARAKERCARYPWVLDMDISKFFDTIDHKLLMKAVSLHVKEKWILLYIERWLKVPYQTKDGKTIARDKGVAQVSVIGPILANLFLHDCFRFGAFGGVNPDNIGFGCKLLDFGGGMFVPAIRVRMRLLLQGINDTGSLFNKKVFVPRTYGDFLNGQIILQKKNCG